MALMAAVALAVFGVFAATGSKPASDFALGITVNGQSAGVVTVADGAKVTIVATFDGIPSQVNVSVAGLPILDGGSVTTLGPPAQDGCIVAPGNAFSLGNATRPALSATQLGLAAAVTDMTLFSAVLQQI